MSRASCFAEVVECWFVYVYVLNAVLSRFIHEKYVVNFSIVLFRTGREMFSGVLLLPLYICLYGTLMCISVWMESSVVNFSITLFVISRRMAGLYI